MENNQRIVYSQMRANSKNPLWVTWPGRNRFCCGGRFITGSKVDNLAIISAHLILLQAVILFTVFEGIYFWIEVSPALTCIGIFLICCSELLLLRAEFTDPGIIIRGDPFEPEPNNPNDKDSPENKMDPFEAKEYREKEDKKIKEQNEIWEKEDDQERKKFMEEIANLPKLERKKRKSEFKMQHRMKQRERKQDDLHIYKSRWCYTCKVWRPPMASHCGSCDNCVKGFDHHCVFINNCVGARNMKYFVGFLMEGALTTYFLAFVTVYYFVSIFVQIPETHDNARKYIWLIGVGGFLTVVGGYLYIVNMYKMPIMGIPLVVGIIFDFVYLCLVIGFKNIYTNPIAFGLFLSSVPICLWLTGLSFNYLGLISRNMTEKEYMVRHRFYVMKDGKMTLKTYPCWKLISNTICFFFRSVPPSEVFQHRQKIIHDASEPEEDEQKEERPGRAQMV